MALSITTEEATEIKSNSMKFNANVNDLDTYDLALCYFNYGHKSDLSDAQKSTGCALVDQPGHIEFLQDFIDDNQDYYYEANIQNYEGTATQISHLEDMRNFNLNPAKFSDAFIAETIANNKYSLTKLLANKELMYSYFSSGQLGKIWTGENFYAASSGYVRIRAYEKSGYENTNISLNKEINLTDFNTINIDWYNSGDDDYYNYSYIYINGKRVKHRRYNFSRQVETIDVSNINGLSSIMIEARDAAGSSKRSRAESQICIYGIWLEK